MKKLFYALSAFLLLFILAACANAEATAADGHAEAVETEAIQVVATFSIIADMVYQIAGELAEVYTIVPIGDDPHEHEVLPDDLFAVYNADIILYHGLNLETGYYGWFERLMQSVDQSLNYFAVTQGITPLYLTTPGLEDYHDPHAWLDIRNGIIYIQNIARILSDFMPQYSSIFEENASAYISRLYALHNEWVGAFDDIPDASRLLVTAEGAFRYFGYAYNVNVAYIWEINAHEEGTPEQILNIINILNNSEVEVLFTESSIEPHYMEQVSSETGIPIFAMLFTDSLSEPHEQASTYYDMMRFNLETIHAGLAR